MSKLFSIESNYSGTTIRLFGIKIHLKNQNRDLQQQLSRIEYGVHINYLILDEIIKNQILSDYGKEFDTHGIKFRTDYPEAFDSNDNKFPISTYDGILRKPQFSQKIKNLYGDMASLLDIGCGGGGIVYDAISHDIIAYGIDGSTANRRMQHGYWAVLKDQLLTCDACKPYNFEKDGLQFRFKVISSWECLEHIPETEVFNFLQNVYNNLDDDGYFIGSISRLPHFNENTGVVYHVTLKDKNWWAEKFKQSNLEFMEIKDSPFEYSDFCRGIGIGWQDEHTNYLKNSEDGILFVARKN